MRVVLGEAAYTEHAVKHTALLMPVDGSELRVTNGQIAIAPHSRSVDLNMARAVHRLEDELLILYVENVHVFAVVVVVARRPPQCIARDVRRRNEFISPADQHLPEKILYDQPHPCALRVPEDQSGPRFFGDAE